MMARREVKWPGCDQSNLESYVASPAAQIVRHLAIPGAQVIVETSPAATGRVYVPGDRAICTMRKPLLTLSISEGDFDHETAARGAFIANATIGGVRWPAQSPSVRA